MTEQSRASVVEISTETGSGTGWIYRVDNDGKAWILTNEHVVESETAVTVRQDGSSGTRQGTVVGTDVRRDIAVVTICCDPSWIPLETARSDQVQAGSDVVILGFPSGRVGSAISVTTGVVSSYGFDDSTNAWLVQTDAAVNPGNSGGPMMNDNGEVIGIVSFRQDPSTSENIGFAIAMQTVDEQLDLLEAGATVSAPTPTPAAAIAPSTTESVTLVHDVGDGKIGCSLRVNDPTVISRNTVDSAAFLRFEVPDVRNWSIGFLYHDPEDNADTGSVTIISASDSNGIQAEHWVRVDGVRVHYSESDQISRNTLRTGRGQLNELVFRTSSRGSFLRLNDEIVIDAPDSQLIRRSGKAQLCAGFYSDEELPYEIHVEDLRTRFTRQAVSGSLANDDPDDGLFGCAEQAHGPSYFSDDAIDSWVLLNFGIPRATQWSIVFLHHAEGGNSSRTVFTSGDSADFAMHKNQYGGETVDGPLGSIPRGLLKLGPGNPNVLEFETTADGSWLRLNGEKILDVPATELFRQRGSSEMCVAYWTDDSVGYTLHFSDLWAWAE